MAESAVDSVLRKLEDDSVKVAFNQCGVSEQMVRMSGELRSIQPFLQGTDTTNTIDERKNLWLEDVKNIAESIDVVIGTILRIVEEKPGRMEAAKILFTKIKICLVVRRSLRDEIKKIESKIKEVKKGYDDINKEEQEIIRPPPRRPVIPVIEEEPDVVGFEEHKKNIISLLIDQNTARRSVIAIEGLGGVGKTTLALTVYNSAVVKKHFGIRLWVYISQQFAIIEILKDIAEALGIPQFEDLSLESHLTMIKQYLVEKRYLLVLDDIWTSDPLSFIQKGLPDANNGSRILTTTRISKIVEEPSLAFVSYKLDSLDEKSSLELLLKKALPSEMAIHGYPVELYGLAKQIVAKLGGLALALSVVGGILSREPFNYNSWNRVIQQMSLVDGETNIIASIALSYDNLSNALKLCLQYFSIFPEDYEIDAKILLRMWIGERFVMQKDDQTSEEIAETYLEDLVSRNLIQVSKSTLDGSIESCRIHDLIHEFAIQKAKDDNFLMVCTKLGDVQKCSQTRRVAIMNVEPFDKFEESYGKEMAYINPNLRSLLGFDFLPKVSGFQNLRLLSDMGQTCSAYKPNKFGRLNQLSYFQLSLKVDSRDISNFQLFISSMRFLQTLDLRGGSICDLPDSVWNVTTLRHVLLPTWPGFTSGPPPSTDLVNLQTLTGVTNRESWKGKGPNLPELKILEIGPKEKSQWDTIAILLHTLEKLVSLEIVGDDVPLNIIDMKGFPFYYFLKHLVLGNEYMNIVNPCQEKIDLGIGMFPTQLTTLRLKCIQFQQDPMPVLEKLENLKLLFLGGSNCQQLCCSAGQFGKLEELEFWELEELKEWKIEKGAMAVLKKLTVSHCPELKEWKIEDDAMAKLKKLTVSHCPLLSIPEGLQHLRELQKVKWYSRSPFHKISETKKNEIYSICKHVPSISTPPVWLIGERS
ncbi:Disease resistance family protein [Rhynchospora pubera]|uniref:Disease resistance family protein n=1 Tax=Rhynchospora pubera TaxID=906938 RepID=A0AAV8GVY1_9POAL|nr:Disease resistance family protein [Rhynchospora pubera]